MSYLQIGDRESNYDAFLADLCVKDGDADDCRYAIYDYEYVVHAQGTEASHRSVKKSLKFKAAISKILVFFTGLDSFWSAGVPIPPASKRR